MLVPLLGPQAWGGAKEGGRRGGGHCSREPPDPSEISGGSQAQEECCEHMLWCLLKKTFQNVTQALWELCP